MKTHISFSRTHSNRQADAAINFFSEYPSLHNHINMEEFIDDLIEPSNSFFSDMLREGLNPIEAQELTTRMYVIEPLIGILGEENLGYLLDGD